MNKAALILDFYQALVEADTFFDMDMFTCSFYFKPDHTYGGFHELVLQLDLKGTNWTEDVAYYLPTNATGTGKVYGKYAVNHLLKVAIDRLALSYYGISSFTDEEALIAINSMYVKGAFHENK